EGQTRRVLQTIFEGLMRPMHPIMPYLPEDLWQRMPKSIFLSELESIMFAPFPREDHSFFDDEAEAKMNLLIRAIRAVRNIRQTYNVPASSEAEVIIHCADDQERKTLILG